MFGGSNKKGSFFSKIRKKVKQDRDNKEKDKLYQIMLLSKDEKDIKDDEEYRDFNKESKEQIEILKKMLNEDLQYIENEGERLFIVTEYIEMLFGVMKGKTLSEVYVPALDDLRQKYNKDRRRKDDHNVRDREEKEEKRRREQAQASKQTQRARSRGHETPPPSFNDKGKGRSR